MHSALHKRPNRLYSRRTTRPATLYDQPKRGTLRPARERRAGRAREDHSRRGELPDVSRLMTMAQVARGTAGAALKQLRAERPALQVVHPNRETRTDQ